MFGDADITMTDNVEESARRDLKEQGIAQSQNNGDSQMHVEAHEKKVEENSLGQNTVKGMPMNAQMMKNLQT